MLIVSLLICSCSTVEEPESASTSKIRATRSSQTETLSESEAVLYAKEALGLDSISSSVYSVDKIMAKSKEAKELFTSGIIAYAVSFGDHGSVLIANELGDIHVLMAKKSGSFAISNGKQGDANFALLEDFLIKRKNRMNSISGPLKNIEDEHWLCGTHVTTGVTTGAPFNSVVLQKHPNCDAGSVPGNCAVMVSYTQNKFRLSCYEYGCPDIVYCLNQGPGYYPPAPYSFGVVDPGSLDYLLFLNSYDGAVDATSSLISTLGDAMFTSYNESNSTTYISNARKALEEAGCEVTPLYYKFNPQGIWELLYNGYFILQEAYNIKTNEKVSFLITGGENIYYDGNAKSLDTALLFHYCVDDKFPVREIIICADGHYDYGDNSVLDYNLQQYFGVKIREDAYRDNNCYYHF